MITGTPEHDGNGYLIISDAPGIGVELKPDAREKLPYTPPARDQYETVRRRFSGRPIETFAPGAGTHRRPGATVCITFADAPGTAITDERESIQERNELKITKVEPIFLDRYLLVEIETDAGITGLGESGAWGYLESSAVAIEKYGRYLMGKDPLRIEHHWQFMYRSSHFRGSAIMGAISAIDIALWDIAGKHFDVPVHQLLGGKVRDKARVYYHVFGNTREKLVNGVKAAKELGFTAVGHLTPFLDESHDLPYFKTHVAKIEDAIDTVADYREAVGRDVDLCIEIHRRLTPTEAVQLGLGIEKFHPYFFEDPVTPDNIDEMAYVADKINIPIATGERFTSLWDFEMALSRNAVQYVRPDVCIVGGISATKKIAAAAEARHVGSCRTTRSVRSALRPACRLPPPCRTSHCRSTRRARTCRRRATWSPARRCTMATAT